MSALAKPFVSVIMPLYNHAAFVVDAVQSVLSQEGVEIELIVIDDASSDTSWELVNTIHDERVRCFRHEKNLGAHTSLNEGLAIARGEWLAIINSDDLFASGRLLRCVAHMQTQGLDLVGSDICLMDGSGHLITEHWWVSAFNDLKQCWHTSHDWASTLLFGNVFMTTSNFVMRRQVFERLGDFSADRYVHDYDYLLRALALGVRMGWIDEPLLRYRLHENNTISASPLAANRECAALLRRILPRMQKLFASPQHGLQRIEALSAQWARMDRYVDEIWAALQHQALVNKENELIPLIHDRDSWIQERDRRITDLNQWIKERDQWIAERDQWIAERDQLIAERDQLIAARDQLIAARDQEIAEREQRIAARDQVILTMQNQQAEQEQRNQRLLQALTQAQSHIQKIEYSKSYRLARLLGWPVRNLRTLWKKMLAFNYRQRWLTLFSAPPLPQHAILIRAVSLDEIQNHLQNLPANVRCISFDVFDTLLARCIEPPDSLQRRVCAEIADKLGLPHTPESVWQARQFTENELRQACLNQGGDYECHFEPLVEIWVERLLGQANPVLVEWIHRCERRIESLALSAKPGIHSLLQKLHARGLRVIAVSDMYLGEEHVRALLHDCGLGALIDQLYVSADYGVGKYSGRLHQHVLDAEGLQPDQVIHIGDNLASDMLAPLRLGIQGIFLDEREERLRRRHQSLSAEMAQQCDSQPSVWQGRHFFEIVAQHQRLNLAPPSENLEFFEHYGRDILGSLFSGFTLGLVEHLRTFKPDKVFFLARDGYLFQQLYTRWGELMDADEAPLPKACYAYVSRRVVASAAIAHGMTHAQALVGLYNPKQHGLLSVLKTYGLPIEDFRAHAQRHGFLELDTPLHDWHDPRLFNFLADEQVQSQIKSFGHKARADLETYLSQLGFFDCQRVALVDIGWSGTIQKFLNEAFAHRDDFPEVRGYYFAFVGQMHSEFAQGDKIEGLLCDVRHQNACELTPGEFEELFEQGARALEATTLGYSRREDGSVVPILKADDAPDRQGEIACNPYITAMHKGVINHLEHFFAAQQLTGYSFSQLKPYLQAVLERAVVYPTQEEMAHISQLVHTEDFGHDHTLEIGSDTLRWQHILRPRQFLHQLRIAPWRYVIFARLGTRIPIHTWLYRVFWLRKKK
jgi:glycosyltransferase involved in cell wall biosynthesis/FMN phosphatase YigB (HAD superfamily)